jgi:hypothetical protein
MDGKMTRTILASLSYPQTLSKLIASLIASMKNSLVNLTSPDFTDQLPLPVVLPPCRAVPTDREGQVESLDIDEAAEWMKAVRLNFS